MTSIIALHPDFPGQSAAEVLAAAGIRHPLPCGGGRRCGNCALWLRGALSPADTAECALLQIRSAGMQSPGEGFALRLACCCRLLGDAECILPTPDDTVAAVHAPARPLPAYDGDAPGSLGVAADIGATTITLELFRFPSAAAIASVSEMNRQNTYGADVLNRISAVKTLGLAALSQCLRKQLGAMLHTALGSAQAQAGDITRAVVTGNTTMLHFFAGLDPSGMGSVPFTPQSLFGKTFPASLLPGLPPGAELYLPPSISAFIGADITCGALAVDLCGTENALLADIGTNGEMLLHTAEGALLCCSVAAGPAFEGAEISMGMPALSGAIDRVWAEEGRLHWHAISGADGRSTIMPRGICGTGLVSALRSFLACGLLDESGNIANDEQSLRIGSSGIAITQQDIRKLQLVKASVAAGIETLLSESGLSAAQLRTLWLAGGFGSYLQPADAAAIGMIPGEAAAAAEPAGNTALRGAEMLCLSKALRTEALRTVRRAKEVPLATHPMFQTMFIEKMAF